jgi:1-acyl-sn-glycerol-3-phosphate acyltransferase
MCWRPLILVAVRPSLLYRIAALLSVPFLRFVFRLETHGKEHVPREGGFVLAANHNSNFDPWPLGVPLFPQRFLRFMAKSELYWWPLGVLLDAGGAFPVRRGERDEQAIQTAVELCRAGHCVVMFPEGTRRRKGLRKKWEARAHSGAARIAIEAGVPLIPAAIRGTDELRRLAKLRVDYGAPIPLDDLAGQDIRDASREATDRLMSEIHRLEFAQ